MSKKKFLGCLFAVLAFAMPNMVSAETNDGWTTIVSKVKNSQTVTELKEEYDVTITDDDYKMVIEISNDTMTNPLTMTYNYAKEIVHFTSSNTDNNVTVAVLENEINDAFLTAVAEYYGYDADSFNTWLASTDSSTLTVGEDGLEYTTYTIEYVEEGLDLSIESFKTLTVNVECGVSSFHEVTPEPEPEPVVPDPDPIIPEPDPETPIIEETVENPPTGLYISVAAIFVALVGFVTFGLSKKKNYFSKI